MAETVDRANPTVLIVDDEESVRVSLELMLRGNFETLLAESAPEAMTLLHERKASGDAGIDLVLSDICMGQMDGIQLLQNIKKTNPDVEVILITGYPNSETTLSALRLGACDYIAKPFQIKPTLDAINKAIDKRKRNKMGEKVIHDLKEAIQKNYTDTTEALLLAIDAKDNYTKEHCRRVAIFAVELARKIGMDEEQIELLDKVAALHDIGKIGVREQVLNKKGPLDNHEWEEMRQHPVLGHQILQPVDFLKEVRDIMLYHHERYDGRGYPKGLKGEEIPLGARIVSLADTYDALVTDRPYRKGLSVDEAVIEIEKNKGIQFDPELAEEFLMIIRNQATVNN